MFSSLLLYLFAAACGHPQDGLERRGIDVCGARPREHVVCGRFAALRLCLVTFVALRVWGQEWDVSARQAGGSSETMTGMRTKGQRCCPFARVLGLELACGAPGVRARRAPRRIQLDVAWANSARGCLGWRCRRGLVRGLMRSIPPPPTATLKCTNCVVAGSWTRRNRGQRLPRSSGEAGLGGSPVSQ